MIVRESLTGFHRGLTDEQIKDVLFGQFHRGQIIGMDINKEFHNAWNVWLYVYVGQDKDNANDANVLYIGRIQVRGGKAHIDPFYHNHDGFIEYGMAGDVLRELTPKEKKQVEEALTIPKNQKHIPYIKEKTGFTPFLV